MVFTRKIGSPSVPCGWSGADVGLTLVFTTGYGENPDKK